MRIRFKLAHFFELALSLSLIQIALATGVDFSLYTAKYEILNNQSELRHIKTSKPDEILVDGSKSFDLSDQEKHKLQSINDQLCPTQNVKNNTCYVSQKYIRFTSDFHYQTSYNLVFDSVELRCQTVNYKPCTLYFWLNGTNTTFTMNNKTILEGQQVIIKAHDSRVVISTDSMLFTTGQSYNYNGTMINNTGSGANFIGQGGSCERNVTYKTYGEFDMIPNPRQLSETGSQLGSMGKYADVETAGGGRIIVAADSLVFVGTGVKMEANGLPLQDYSRKTEMPMPGGSGGYIYITTFNKLGQNELDPDSIIQARGGYGQGGAAGGSGGVIVVDGGFDMLEELIDTQGGLGTILGMTHCGNGAAGTIWNRKTDKLIIDNKDLPSKQLTIIKPPIHSWSHGKPRVIAENIDVKGQARIQIAGEHDWMSFKTLFMHSNTYIELLNDTPKLVIHFTGDINLSSSSTFDLSNVVFAQLDSTNTTVRYGNIIYQRRLAVLGSKLSLQGNIQVPQIFNDTQKQQSQLLLTCEYLQIEMNVQIQAGYQILQANNTLQSQTGVSISSYIQNTCNEAATHSDLFTCVPRNALDLELNAETFTQAFNTQFGTQYTRVSQMVPTLMNNFTVYLISFEQIDLMQTIISGPRVGLCAPSVTMTHSTIDTSGRGCISDQGLGKGIYSSECSASGGAHGGQGGHGGVLDLSDSLKQRCQASIPFPYYYQNEARYEGSGGASSVKNKAYGGSGGGIIWISSTDTVKLQDTQILAQGMSGMESELGFGSGGGAGGSIQLITTNVQGDALVSVKGGDGSDGGGGGGAGGRLVVLLLQHFMSSSYPMQSYWWDGTTNLEGGKGGWVSLSAGFLKGGDGQKGTAFHTKCHGGYNGPFCKPCEAGTFKYDFSYALCIPCENKPKNSYYIGKGASNSNCPYECSEGLDPQEINPHCQNIFELQVYRLGGTFSTLGVISVFFTFCLILWACLIARSRSIQKQIGDYNSILYNGVLFRTDSKFDESESITGARNLRMNDSDIWSHSHRMYLIGENSISFPWYIPKDFPNKALGPADKERLIKFIKTKQLVLDWSDWEKNVYYLFRIFFPPLASVIHQNFRRKHFNALQDAIYSHFDSSFWDERKSKTLRLSTSKYDKQLAYIDFLDYNKSKQNYIGPKLPIALMLAGNGTYENPYTLNFEDDPLAKSLVYLDKQGLKTKLPIFLENLNTLLAKLSFYKLNRQCMKDLSELLEWIDQGNQKLFNPLDVKATIYIFDNSYLESEDGIFKQRRRSLPLEPLIFETFPDQLKKLIKFVQTKLLAKKCELRFGLVIKSFKLVHQRKLQDRIRKVIAQRNQAEQSGYEIIGQQLLFVDDDIEDTELDIDQAMPIVSIEQEQRSCNLGNIRRGQEESVLMSESRMDESLIEIHGAPEFDQSVKIINKSKRAFSFSEDSTKAFEIALQKPRNKCKHRFTRFRAILYALWIFAFKHHGKPPGKRGLYMTFLTFASLLSIDCILLIAFIMHLIGPISNLESIGIPFLAVYPGLTLLAPAVGCLTCLTGDARFMKFYSALNASCALVNYPLTILVQCLTNDEPPYIAMVILLLLNKIALSYVGAKVRQHLLNPGFEKNQKKISQTFKDFVYGKSERLEYAERIDQSQSPANRISQLVSSGPPKPISGQNSSSDEETNDVTFGQ